MADILRNSHRSDSRDEQANHQGSGDGGRPHTSRSRSRPNWTASPESMSHGEAEVPRQAPSRGRTCPQFTTAKEASREDNEPNDDNTSALIPQPETRPLTQEQLVAEVKAIYAGLVMVETKCIEVDNALPSLTKPIIGQWKVPSSLPYRSRRELDTYLYSCYTQDSHSKAQRLAFIYSLHTRAQRRLNDRLLPLLRREQDVRSSFHWLAASALSYSLLEILSMNESAFKHPEVELQDTLDQIEAILARLQVRFRNKHHELSRKKGPAELVFEFPDNIRHICTQMPWTISPVLVVLWGVCWMFIIGLLHAEHDKPSVVDPMIAPSPATQDFHDNSVVTSTGDVCQSPTALGFDDTGYVSLPTIETLSYSDGGMMNDFFNDPLDFIQATPRDPIFLTTGAAMSSDTDNYALLGEEDPGRLAGSAGIPPNPARQTYHGTEQHGSIVSALGVVMVSDGKLGVNSNSPSQQSKPRFVCPDCQESFATSFTLNRHRAETHKQGTSASETLFPCPNPQCKRSKGRFPFKRPYNLKRHLESCKHHRETSVSQEERGPTLSISTSVSASASPDRLNCPAALPEEAAELKGRKKRPIIEDEDDESSDEQLVRDMAKEYKRISKEVEEKKRVYLQALDEQELVAATIQVLRKKNKKDT